MDKFSKRTLPTLEDVAKAANVSTATASRCINEPNKVTEKTKARVMEAVKSLHYAPNFGARAIAANRTNIYGVIIPTMENAIFARGVEAFQKALVAKNATMLVATTSYNMELEEQHIRTMIARGANGMMLIGTDRNPRIYEFLQARNIPAVVAWAVSDDAQRSYVGFNNRASSRKLAELALSLGHKHFGYIAADTTENDRARDRMHGADDALAAAGIDPCSMKRIETEYSLTCGRNACYALLRGDPRPSIIMCGNDVLAVGAIQAAQEAGLRVPQDISITGFDDIELATVIQPAVTTVHVPHRKMGRMAADILLDLLDDQSVTRQIELDTTIIERASLGPPPN